MNAITQFLLAGAALGALATAPAIAGDAPHFSLTALHGGIVVQKTAVARAGHGPCSSRTGCYTFSIYTSVPASDLGVSVHLYGTYYKWNSAPNGYFTICSRPKQWIKLSTKRTQYARIGKATETYSLGCPSGPTVFNGDTYKLKESSGEGKTDTFISTLYGRFKGPSGGKYKGELMMPVYVQIGS